MIINKTISIRINGSGVKKYKDLGYIFNNNDIVDVKIEDVSLNSMVIITAICDYCDNIKELTYRHYIRNIEKYNKFSCSNKCGRNKSKITIFNKYGVDNYAKTDECKSKIKETSFVKYGVDNYAKTDECKSKIKENNLKKYGVIHPTLLDETILKMKKTNLERYGVECNLQLLNTSKSEEYHSKTKIGNNYNYIKYLDNSFSLFNCDKGHNFEINIINYHSRINNNTPLCTICNPIGENSSIKEKELFEFISNNYQGEIISSYRDKLEIDIYLPELKLGFEFNGLYWHSEKFKDKRYHLDKTNYFCNKDIRIIHIWEDDWIFKQDVVKSQILNLLGKSEKIYARKCLAKEVNVKDARKFLDNNHIQGFVSSVKKIGLYYNGELVSIMTFDHNEGRKKMGNDEWNLNRFCNKIGFNIIGGASKLLNYFIKNNEVSRIVSYADKDWSIGNLYYKLGFENVGGNGPDYKYIVDGKRFHKSRYKKSKLNTSLTESKTMKELGINKIYDCGKIKFELKNN